MDIEGIGWDVEGLEPQGVVEIRSSGTIDPLDTEGPEGVQRHTGATSRRWDIAPSKAPDRTFLSHRYSLQSRVGGLGLRSGVTAARPWRLRRAGGGFPVSRGWRCTLRCQGCKVGGRARFV